MGTAKPDFEWTLEDDHWIELTISDTGLQYIGYDWTCQSGGGYMAGFQSFAEFARDGGLKQMPAEVASAVAEAIATRDPSMVAVTIRLEGAVIDEAHLDLDGQPIVRGRGAVLFEGSLPAGSHELSGIFTLPGADAQGRRTMRRFTRRFEVAGEALEIVLDVEADTEPRWP